jgi:hypothetical protein
VFSRETPFCVIFAYVNDDTDTMAQRNKLIDAAIETRLRYIDFFGHEYKWERNAILAMSCTERHYLAYLITKRNEAGGGDNAFTA